jgi:hypothetical protein
VVSVLKPQPTDDLDGLSHVFYSHHLFLFVYSAEGIVMRNTLCYCHK